MVDAEHTYLVVYAHYPMRSGSGGTGQGAYCLEIDPFRNESTTELNAGKIRERDRVTNIELMPSITWVRLYNFLCIARNYK